MFTRMFTSLDRSKLEEKPICQLSLSCIFQEVLQLFFSIHSESMTERLIPEKQNLYQTDTFWTQRN